MSRNHGVWGILEFQQKKLISLFQAVVKGLWFSVICHIKLLCNHLQDDGIHLSEGILITKDQIEQIDVYKRQS